MEFFRDHESELDTLFSVICGKKQAPSASGLTCNEFSKTENPHEGTEEYAFSSFSTTSPLLSITNASDFSTDTFFLDDTLTFISQPNSASDFRTENFLSSISRSTPPSIGKSSASAFNAGSRFDLSTRASSKSCTEGSVEISDSQRNTRNPRVFKRSASDVLPLATSDYKTSKLLASTSPRGCTSDPSSALCGAESGSPSTNSSLLPPAANDVPSWLSRSQDTTSSMPSSSYSYPSSSQALSPSSIQGGGSISSQCEIDPLNSVSSLNINEPNLPSHTNSQSNTCMQPSTISPYVRANAHFNQNPSAFKSNASLSTLSLPSETYDSSLITPKQLEQLSSLLCQDFLANSLSFSSPSTTNVDTTSISARNASTIAHKLTSNGINTPSLPSNNHLSIAASLNNKFSLPSTGFPQTPQKSFKVPQKPLKLEQKQEAKLEIASNWVPTPSVIVLKQPVPSSPSAACSPPPLMDTYAEISKSALAILMESSRMDGFTFSNSKSSINSSKSLSLPWNQR